MVELKPCPHCSASEAMVDGWSGPPSNGRWVWCPACRTRGPLAHSEAEAARLWNALPRTQGGAVEVVEGVLNAIRRRQDMALADREASVTHIDHQRHAAAYNVLCELVGDVNALSRAALAESEKPLLCEECGIYPADPPRNLCAGCDAYRDHTGAI